MLNRRTPRQEVEEVRRIVQAYQHLERRPGVGGILIAVGGERIQDDKSALIEALDRFLETREPLDKETLRQVIVCLDLYNIRQTDNLTRRWDASVEALHQSWSKRFGKHFGEPVYPADASAPSHGQGG
jgi:hypothetical protein